MSTFVLIPGAGGVAWYWSRVVDELRRAGHEAIAVDLPGDDDAAGLAEYADIVISKCHDDVVLVAQSLGGFTAPLVCEQIAVRTLVFVNAMIPERGETPGAWWGNVGWDEARISAANAGGYPAKFDLETYFLHDVAPDVAAEGEPYQRNEADAVFASTCAFTAWPEVPTHALAGADDRFFPVEFQRRVARDRLGLDADTLAGGHLIALANPTGVAGYLNRVAAPA